MQAEADDPHLPAKVQSFVDGLAGIDAQIIVSCEEPWDLAPEGVEVVSFPSAGKGDRCDAAARRARGDLLAFIDSRVRFDREWGTRALEILEDPSVVIAGGPVRPTGESRRERVGALIMTGYLGGRPTAHNGRASAAREVREVGLSNMVMRTSAFRAVGGFQAPVKGGGEAARLCYKVRALLGGIVRSEPGLALTAPAPSVSRLLLREIGTYGRSRGDLARRLREAAPLFPYALPSLAVLAFIGAIGLVAATGGAVRLGLVAFCSALIVASVASLERPLQDRASVIDRLLAGIALPLVLSVFGVTFMRGFVGKSMGEISPPRDRVRPLRVLILNWRDVTHPWSGGAETYMHQLAKRWAADGMHVEWLTQRHAGSSRHDVIDRIQIRRLGGRLTLYARAALSYAVRLRNRFDIIVDCENGVPFFSPFYSRIPRALVVHHVHQEIFRTQVPRQLRWFALWLEGRLMPRMYRNTQVVAVSEGTRDDLVALGFRRERIALVTNGVDPPKPVDRPPASHPTVLCMGRLKPQKSVDVLIRALPGIVERFPDLQVDVVGQGPDRTRLERLTWSLGLAQHVRFHGYVRGQVRDELAAEAWIAVCPSSFEGWGVVCMEASARGLPVVASNVAGLRESVRDGETGILVPYGDPTALARAVISLLQDRDLRARLGEAGVAWAARHTWDQSAVRFAQLMTTAVVDHRRPAVERPEPLIDLSAGEVASEALAEEKPILLS